MNIIFEWYIKRSWRKKSDVDIVGAYAFIKSKIKLINNMIKELGADNVSEYIVNNRNECQEVIDKYIIPEIKKRNLEEYMDGN